MPKIDTDTLQFKAGSACEARILVVERKGSI